MVFFVFALFFSSEIKPREHEKERAEKQRAEKEACCRRHLLFPQRRLPFYHFLNSRRGVGWPPTKLRTKRTVRDVKAASCCKLPWQETREDEHLCGASCGAEQSSLLPAVLLKKAAAVCHATSVWAESPAQLKLSTSP